MKSQKRISNPMTVIAIFAAISETSAAVSLPFLGNQERETYVWFLISFPFYLLFLFFITLNFNYRSLYAPSDFEKGKHFIKAMDDAPRTENGKTPSATPKKRTAMRQSLKKRSPANPSTCAQPESSGSRKPRHRPRTTTDPPVANVGGDCQCTEFHWAPPKHLKQVRLIDARCLSSGEELATLIQDSQNGTVAQMVLYLIDDRLSVPNEPPHLPRGHSSLHLMYNLSTLDLTRVHQA